LGIPFPESLMPPFVVDPGSGWHDAMKEREASARGSPEGLETGGGDWYAQEMSTTSKVTGESFLGLVKQSGLIDQELLKKAWKEMRAQGATTDDPVALAEEFFKRNLLTRWQIDKLLQGKHKGFLLGKYRLLSLLGSGGMSSVYLAEHVLMRRRVAIKVLPKSRVDDSSYLQRFHREAQAVASLDHRNIVRAYDVDNEDKTHFLVMEYVSGCSLQTLVDKEGPLAPVAAAEYIRQAAEGLHHAHKAGMVHRDIKPGNVLLDEKGTVKLLDLGLARFFNEKEESSLTRKHDEKVLGTADYLSPEQALDSHLVDVRSDVYSLGCTLYFLLTGRPPFPDGTMAQRLLAHQTKQPTPIHTLRPETPPELVAVVDRMMAKKPDDRFQSAKDASQALLQWLSEHGGAAWAEMNPSAGVANSVISAGGSSIVGHSDVFTGDTVVQSRGTAHGAGPGSGSSIGVGGSSIHPPGSSVGPANRPGAGPASIPTAFGAEETNAEPELAAFLSKFSSDVARPSPPSAAPVSASDEPTRIAPPSPDDAAFAPTIASPADDEDATVLHPEQDDAPFAATVPEVAWPEGPLIAESFAATTPPAQGAGGKSAPSPTGTAPPTAVPVAKPVGTKPRTATPIAAPVQKPAVAPKTKLIIAGLSGALVVLLGIVGFLAFGRGGGEADKKKSEKSASTVKKKAKQEAAGPIPFSGRREISVGPTAKFKTIAAALEDTKKYVSRSRNSVQIIHVAGGQTYPERIVIDDTYPRGIQIVVPDGEEATLAPIGSGAIVIVGGGDKSVEDFKLEGFRIDAGGKDVAIQFTDWIPGAQLKRLHISGYARSGVTLQGVQSYHDKQILLEEVKFSQSAPDAVAVTLKKAKEDPAHVRIVKCRFEGPMSAGVLFQSQAIDVEIFESIFHQAETAVKLDGEEQIWKDIVLASNTFFQNGRGLVFTNMPAAGSFGFGFYNNLFFGQKTADAIVEKDLKIPEFLNMYTRERTGAAYNWTDKQFPATPPADALAVMFQTTGCRTGATDVQFVSTDPLSPDFLVPAATSPHKSVGTPDAKRFGPQIGALRPR
jgi:eukaryotic-like serine/threonine-protein kinase